MPDPIDAPALCRRLDDLGAWLQVRGGESTVRIPPVRFTADLGAELAPALAEHREAVLAHFRAKAPAPGDTEPAGGVIVCPLPDCRRRWYCRREEIDADSPHVCGREHVGPVVNKRTAEVIHEAVQRCPFLGRGE